MNWVIALVWFLFGYWCGRLYESAERMLEND